MYSRRAYVSLLAVAIAALQYTAAFGAEWQTYMSYAVAAAFGVVVFYQGERAVTVGPPIVNAGVSILLGTVVSFLFSGALVMYLLGAPWDLSLWQMGILLWDSWVGITVVFVSGFSLVGFVASMY